MTVKEYVDDILCAPVTRVGSRFIVEAIEIVLDTCDHKFYQKLCDILQVSPSYLEISLRTAKNLSMSYMEPDKRMEIFGKENVPTTEYIIKATEYYRRTYENKTEG